MNIQKITGFSYVVLVLLLAMYSVWFDLSEFVVKIVVTVTIIAFGIIVLDGIKNGDLGES